MPAEPYAEMAAEFARLGDEEAAATLRAAVGADAPHPARVVVVGEKKRGKRSLINALLGLPGLLPVDVDIATGVYIALGWTAEPAVLAHTSDGSGRRGLEQVAEYGAPDPVTADMAHPEVTHLEIGRPAPLLEPGLVLVDTARELRERNARYFARRAPAGHIADQERLLRSLAHDPDLLARITADRDRMAEILKNDAAWRTRLADGFKGLDRDLSRTYQRAVAEFQAGAHRRVAEVTPDEIAEVLRDLDAGVRAIWEELETRARRGADAIALGIAADFAADGIDALEIRIPFPTGMERGPEFERSQVPQVGGVAGIAERYLPGMGIAGLVGHTALGAISVTLAASPLAPFALIAAGGVLGNTIYKQRKRREEDVRVRGDLQRHTQNLLRQMNTEVPPALQDGLESMLRTVETGVSARLGEHRAALEAVLAEHRRNLETAEAEPAPRREAAKAAVARLRELAERVA